MKVTAISMVRNEADVIESFVRHHADLIDEFVVVDHGSIDGTTEVLAALIGEGLPVRVRREGSLVHRQNRVLTELMREAAKERGASWVIPLDADEFLLAPGARVREVLAQMQSERPSAVDLHYYVPTPEDPGDEPNVLRRIQYRLLLETDLWTRKVIVPTRWARNGRFALTHGNHALVDARTGKFVDAFSADPLVLAHFPVRSARQLTRKVLGGWPAALARPDRGPGGSFQWKRAFETVASGRRLTPRQLQALAFDYTTPEPDGRRRELLFDPVKASFELRYRAPSEPTPLEILADTAVRLAEELSGALREGSSDAPQLARAADVHSSPPRAARRRRGESS